MSDLLGSVEEAVSVLENLTSQISEDLTWTDDLYSMSVKLKKISEIKDRVKTFETFLGKSRDSLRMGKIPEKMSKEGIDNVEYTGVGKVLLTNDVFASIPAGVKDEAFLWLGDHGFKDLIKNTVHSASLKALAKEQIKNGEGLPEKFFKITPYTRASIRKN